MAGGIQVNVLLVNNTDEGGGAERIARHLLEGYNKAGHQAWMAFGRKQTNHPRIFQIENERYRSLWTKLVRFCAQSLHPLRGRVRGIGRLQSWAELIGQPIRTLRWRRGLADFEHPGSRHLLGHLPEKIDLIHMHNLHGHNKPYRQIGYKAYFDLRFLSEVSQQIPVVMTMHDAWLLSGHCSHALGCERWKTGCGACPDLNLYPSIRKDATALNWKRKRNIYRESRLYLATPCHWLMKRAQQSMLTAGLRSARVIPNGIPLDCFRPADHCAVRERLDINQNSKVVLFVANGVRHNPWKDYSTGRDAVLKVGALLPDEDIIFLCVGEDAPTERINRVKIKFVPFEKAMERMALYYQAADVYVHAAHVDTFPNTILEAFACGTPVIAVAVGGIPEQIIDGENGFLVPPRDSNAMSDRLLQTLSDEQRSASLSQTAKRRAQECFGMERMIAHYLNWFAEICEN